MADILLSDIQVGFDSLNDILSMQR